MIAGQQKIQENKLSRVNEFMRLFIATLNLGNKLTKEEIELLISYMNYEENENEFTKKLEKFQKTFDK